MKTTLLRIGAIAVALQILSASAETQVLYVVPSGTAGNSPESPYATWETAANSIADALSAVTDEAVINVKPGVYNIDQQITVNKPNVTIQSCDENGSLARETTILDGGYPARYPKASTNRLFQIQRENVKLRGLTLQNACVLGDGGGIYVNDTYTIQISGRSTTINVSNFVIDTCIISNCNAKAGSNVCGGGVKYPKASNRNFVITNSVVRDCVAEKIGGGICGTSDVSQWATPSYGILITNSEFIDNRLNNSKIGGASGGIHFGYGPSYVDKCLIKGGAASKGDSPLLNGWGWGVFTNCVFESIPARITSSTGKAAFYNCLFHSTALNMTSTVEVMNSCVFSNITAMADSQTVFGGRIRNCLWTHNNHPFSSAGIVENCTIVSNNTVGVIMVTKMLPQFINCVVYGNKYEQRFSGVNIGYRTQWINGSTSSSLTLKNCYIEDGDTATINNPQAANALTKLQNFDTTGATAAIIAKAKEKGPGFVDKANGDWRLTRKSPLRDAGLNADWMVRAIDLEGKPRLLQLNGKYSATATVDLGCYECDLPIVQNLRIIVR